MNLGPNTVSSTYQFVLNQSGNNPITLGSGQAVNWDISNVVTKTGSQIISGTKTFNDTAIYLQGLIASGNCQIGSYSLNTSDNKIGVESSDNNFGSTSLNNLFGDNSTSNNFGCSAIANNFGIDASTNFFGTKDQNVVDNYFGKYATSNNFGIDAQSNSFGDNSTPNISDNSFGTFAASNSFGQWSANNIFGEAATNVYYSGRFEGPIRLYLAQFSGSKSQAGQLGELKISGAYLYACTGATGGWGRTFLSTF